MGDIRTRVDLVTESAITASAANTAAAGSMEDVAIADKDFKLGKNLEGERGIGGGGADTCSSEMHFESLHFPQFNPIQVPSPLSLVFRSSIAQEDSLRETCRASITAVVDVSCNPAEAASFVDFCTDLYLKH